MIKLSQCMIVKNEEKNIEKALGWAKPVAYEQIVVDTGSNDKTAELAEKMGAKVYHFEWINDFAAAKNHAIEQATGNWIAFLDADEYLTADDTAKLMKELKKIESAGKSRKQTTILNMPWVQLDDHGEVTSISEQTRVFRNIKEIRYVGRIHEQISVYGNIKRIDNISIMHTGYAETEYKEKGKAERNIEILRAELAGKPNDLKLKAYLADSLSSRFLLADNPNAKDLAEIDEIYAEVIKSGDDVPFFLRIKAYKRLLARTRNDLENQQKILSMYIHSLLKNDSSYDEVLGILEEIYNIGSPNDLLLIARAAKDCGATEFARLVITVAQEII